MSSFSAANISSSVFPVVGCDAWANVRIGTSIATQPTSIVNASGMTGAARRTAGIHGISFSHPTRYGNGGHVVIATHEADDFSTYAIPQVGRNVVDGVVWGATTDVGRTAGFSLYTWAFASPAGASGHTLERADLSYSQGHHVNLVAFSFSRHGLTTDYTPAMSGACAAARAYSPYVRNLLKDSETLTTSNWTSNNGLTEVLDTDLPAPEGTSKVWRLVPRSNAGEDASDASLDQSMGNILCTGRRYTFSAYVRNGTMPVGKFYAILFSPSSSNYAEVAFVPSTGSIGQVVSGPWTDIRRGYKVLGDGWTRFFVSARWTGAANAPLSARLHGGNNTTGQHDGIKFVYATGLQVEESVEPTPYIRTEATAPISGDQDYRRVFIPGSAGFGVTGATHNSSFVSMNSQRTPTAYGTIVIPASDIGIGSTPTAYIEGEYNVLGGVSAGSNSEFDITFKTPLNTQNYCVILSNEIEPVSEASPDYGDVNEPVITMIERANKTTAGFRVVALRQVKNSQAGGSVLANSFTRQSNWYQRRLSHRIHFMVFGGGTYGQA